MYKQLTEITSRPAPFSAYTAADLWTDDHVSKQMLAYHLDNGNNLASRPAEFMDRSVEWIVSHFGVEAGTRVADFGCGPGHYTTRLARKGAAVTGIDFSGRSLSYARKLALGLGLEIDYIQQNNLDFVTDDRLQLILMISNDYSALSPEQRSAMLEKWLGILEPDGAVLLDVHSLAFFDDKEETTSFEFKPEGGFWSSEPYYSFMSSYKYPAENILLDRYTIVEPERTRTIYNWLQCFSPESLHKEFTAAGFKVEAFFSDVAGSPFKSGGQEFAVLARKPTA